MSAPSRPDAKKDQFDGNIKENVGHLVGNESLEAKGKAQHSEGVAQETAANVTGYINGTVDAVSGAVKGAHNSVMGNTGDEAVNKVQEKKAEAQKSFNS